MGHILPSLSGAYWCLSLKSSRSSDLQFPIHLTTLKFVRKISSPFVEHRQDFIIEGYLTFVSLLVMLTLMCTLASKGS